MSFLFSTLAATVATKEVVAAVYVQLDNELSEKKKETNMLNSKYAELYLRN